MLGSRISGAVQEANFTGQGRYVDDAPPPLAKQVGDNGFREKVWCSEIHCQRVVPETIIELRNWARTSCGTDTRVIHQDIEHREGVQSSLHHHGGCLWISQIGNGKFKTTLTGFRLQRR